MSLIAILTDFGERDFYVAAMKAVIKNICPSVEIIDITHQVRKWSILDAAYILSCCYDDFPKGTVFLVVVDPGVGTKRLPIAIKSRNYHWVAPDNGVAFTAAQRDGILEARIIENEKLFWRKKSFTFHGRDIFAPTAAHLACGFDFEQIGSVLKNPVLVKEYRVEFLENGLVGYVVHIDDFGNVALSITDKQLSEVGIRYGDTVVVEIRGERFNIPFVQSFGKVRKESPLLLVNSCERLEIAINQGNAAEVFSLSLGDKVKILKKG